MRRVCCYCPKWSDAPFHLLNHKTADKIHLDTRIIGIKMTKKSVTSEVMSQMVSVPVFVGLFLSFWALYFRTFVQCVSVILPCLHIKSGLLDSNRIRAAAQLDCSNWSLWTFPVAPGFQDELFQTIRASSANAAAADREYVWELTCFLLCSWVLVESSRTLWLFFRVWPLNVTAAYIKPVEGVSNDFTPHRCRRTLFIVNLQPN